jgi:hypothetical protein
MLCKDGGGAALAWEIDIVLGGQAMETIDRRSFLKTTGIALTTGALASASSQIAAAAPAPAPWRKAYMLGGRLTSDDVLDQFQLVKDAGFEGV